MLGLHGEVNRRDVPLVRMRHRPGRPDRSGGSVRLQALELRHERVDRTKLGVGELCRIEQIREALMPVLECENGYRALSQQRRHHNAHDVRNFLIDELHVSAPGNRRNLINWISCKHCNSPLRGV